MIEWFQISVFESVVGGLTLAALIGLWAMMRKFIKEQREANKANKMSIRSMQRAEILRYFRIVVEQGNPVSPEELSHLEACYNAYHESGGNGTGTLMYNRILENAKIVTIASERKENENVA